MGAIHQDHTGVSLAGRDDLLGAIRDYLADLWIARLRRLIWVNQERIDTAQAFALSKWKDL